MKLRAIRDFLAVVEHGSLRAVARQLGGAQPTLSHNIRELERELGVVLFERNAKGVELTPMGKVFFQRARSIQSEVRRAKEELDQMRGETRGRVSVALSSVAHIALLPDAFRPFRTAFPNVKLDLIDALYTWIEKDLRSGVIDCYVGPLSEEVAGDLMAEKLFDNERVVVCRNGHPLADAKTLAELVDAEWMTGSITLKPEAELGPLFAQHGLPEPRLVVQAHSALTYLVTLAYSDVLMCLPIQWPQFPLWKDVLHIIKIREVIVAPAIYIVRRNALPLTPAAEYFCAMIRRSAGYRQK